MSLETKDDDDFIAWLLKQEISQEENLEAQMKLKEKGKRKKKEESIKLVNNVYKNNFMEAYKAMRDAPGDKEAKNDYLVAFTQMYRNVIPL
jgi:adenine-specific DNA methylase